MFEQRQDRTSRSLSIVGRDVTRGTPVDHCDFGRQLAYARLTRGYTQVELAERTGLSARCISDLERGINAAPRLSTLGRLINGLGLDKQETRALREVATCARVRLRFGDDAALARRRGRRRRAAGTG